MKIYENEGSTRGYGRKRKTLRLTPLKNNYMIINNCLNKRDTMTTKEWQQLQQGLDGQLSEKDSSLRIKSQRFWSDICNNEAKFNLKEQLVNVILTVTLDEIKFFISHSLFKSAKTDRIILMSQTEQALVAEKDISATVIDNIANFCQNCPKRH